MRPFLALALLSGCLEGDFGISAIDEVFELSCDEAPLNEFTAKAGGFNTSSVDGWIEVCLFQTTTPDDAYCTGSLFLPANDAAGDVTETISFDVDPCSPWVSAEVTWRTTRDAGSSDYFHNEHDTSVAEARTRPLLWEIYEYEI